MSLSPIANLTLEWLANPPRGTIEFAGVPFNLGNGGNTTFATQVNNVENRPTEGILNVSIENPQTVFVLLSGGWLTQAVAEQKVGEFELIFDNSDVFVFDIIAGIHVRETWHYSNPTQRNPYNVIFGVTPSDFWQNVWVENQQRSGDAFGFLDMLRIPIPNEYQNLSLTKIVIRDTSSALDIGGSPDPGLHIAGITVQRASYEPDEDPFAMLPRQGLMCVAPLSEEPTTRWSLKIVRDVQAARDAGFPEGECTSLLDQVYTDITRRCLDRPADAHMWDDQFLSNCPEFPVSNTPQTGAIAVWEASAAGNSDGHVAFVEQVHDDGTFDVHEYNWAQDTPQACGEDRRCGLRSQSGISFIHMVCTTTPLPLDAEGAASYLVVTKEVSPENEVNIFVYYDTLRGTWDGVRFSNVRSADGVTLFWIEEDWQFQHPDWTEFNWIYVHVCSGQ